VQSDRRIIFTADARFAVASAEADKPRRLTGYPIIWGALSDDRGGYKVRLAPNSARFANPVHALYHHEFADILGTTENGSMRLASDATGVKVEIDLPDTTLARDTAALVTGRYVQGMSFAMVETPWGWGSDGQPVAVPNKATVAKENGETIVTALDYEVDEVTITPLPSFVETRISAAQYARRKAARDAFIAQRHQVEKLRFDLLTLPRAS
jgi:uncharacterized protein